MKNKNLPALVSCSLGSFISWYDFLIFAYATAMVFSSIFFTDMGYIIPLLVFAVGFIIRPLGSVVFGHFGDKFGRKNTLVLTLFLTAISTVGIGFLPNYAEIGIWAPVLLIVARVVQTFAFGAEQAATSTIIYEYYKDSPKRNFFNNFVTTGLPMATVAATAMFWFANSWGREEFLDWAWRLPFLFSAVLFVVGLYARYKMLETPVFQSTENQSKVAEYPVVDLVKNHGTKLFWSIGANALGASWNYLIVIFGFAYMVSTHNIPRPELSELLFYVALFGIPLSLFYGWLGDKFNRLNIINFSALLSLVIIVPVITWMSQGLIVLPLLIGYMITSKLPYTQAVTTYSELFPSNVRQTATGLVMNVSAVVGGGITPILAQWVFKINNNLMDIGWVMLFMALFGLISGLMLKKYHYVPTDSTNKA